jgi:universal stress protein F
MYNTILVAVDLEHGEVGARLLQVAKRLASEGGTITILNVVQPMPSYIGVQVPSDVVDRHRRDTEARLRELAASAPGVTIVTALGAPGSAIVDEARRLGADAIVVGSHRPGPADFLLGSTAARVVRHAPCTVVVERAAVSA